MRKCSWTIAGGRCVRFELNPHEGHHFLCDLSKEARKIQTPHSTQAGLQGRNPKWTAGRFLLNLRFLTALPKWSDFGDKCGIPPTKGKMEESLILHFPLGLEESLDPVTRFLLWFPWIPSLCHRFACALATSWHGWTDMS